MRDQEITQLARDLFNIIKQIPNIRPQVTGLGEGITRAEFELLAFLAINQGPEQRLFSSSELSNLLSITPAAVTHMINPLESAGLVERVHDEKDRRLVLIRLTKRGETMADQLIEHFKTNLAGFISYLGQEDAQDFIRLMQKLLSYFADLSVELQD